MVLARPVHELTWSEALAELESISDNPPERLVDHPAWKARKGELELWIVLHQPRTETAAEPATAPEASPEPPTNPEPPTTTAPSPKEAPMPTAQSPDVQLDTLLSKLSNATGEAVTALDEAAFKHAQNQIHQFRWQIKKLVKDHHLESPVLPAIPDNPWRKTYKQVEIPATPAPIPAIKSLSVTASSLIELREMANTYQASTEASQERMAILARGLTGLNIYLGRLAADESPDPDELDGAAGLAGVLAGYALDGVVEEEDEEVPA